MISKIIIIMLATQFIVFDYFHSLNKYLQMQLMEIEATQLNKSQSSGQFDARPRSVEVTQEYRANIEIQTDESFLRNCKSAADIGSFVPRKIREKTLRPVDSKEAIEELINDEEQMAHLVRLSAPKDIIRIF